MILVAFLTFAVSHLIVRHQSDKPLSRRWLNRFLFDSCEVCFMDEEQQTSLSRGSHPPVVTLAADDYRTVHAAKILGVRNNDKIRAGIVSSKGIDGSLTDSAVVEWVPQGKVKKAEPLKNGNPPGLLRIHLHDLRDARSIESTSNEDALTADPDPVNVSLILALPRPLQLNRILPMVSQMGVSDLILTGASKVPRDYFGSHLFRKPHILRERLVEGLCQAGDVRLPNLVILKQLHFLAESDINTGEFDFDRSVLDRKFPLDEYARVVAHPLRVLSTHDGASRTQPIRMDQVKFPKPNKPKILLAIGPEGGWGEPEEIEWFLLQGFQHVTLGPRVLRSDCAVVSLLALAHLTISRQLDQALTR